MRSGAILFLCAFAAGCPQSVPSRDADVDVDAGSDADEGEPLLECGYPDAGYGFEEGDHLEPFWLWTCEGERTSLPRLWCGQGVTIVHVSTAWCSVCEEATRQLLARVMGPLAGEPVRLVEVLAQESEGTPATVETCVQWSSRFEPALTTYVPPEARLEGALARVVDLAVPPTILVVDQRGLILLRDTGYVPEFVDIDMARVLDTVEEALADP